MTKKNWVFIFFIMLVTFTASFGQITSGAYRAVLKTLYKHDVPLISCEKANLLKSPLFLDTRAHAEFNVSHIAQARWVGYEEFTLDKVKNIDKGTPIVLYCSIGVRSERIGRKLIAAGFTHVQNLYGSIFEWVNQGYPVVDSTGQATLRVHAYSPAWGVWLKKGEKVYD